MGLIVAGAASFVFGAGLGLGTSGPSRRKPIAMNTIIRKSAIAARTTSERLPTDHGSPLRISIETSARPKATSARHVAENQQMPEVSRRRSMGERTACKGYAVKKVR